MFKIEKKRKFDKKVRKKSEICIQSVPLCFLFVLIRLFSSPFINGNFIIINSAWNSFYIKYYENSCYWDSHILRWSNKLLQITDFKSDQASMKKAGRTWQAWWFWRPECPRTAVCVRIGQIRFSWCNINDVGHGCRKQNHIFLILISIFQEP